MYQTKHLHRFQVTKDSVMIYKGTEPDIESYSAFFDNQKLRQTKMRSVLKKNGVTDVYICGIATDVCVGKQHTLSPRLVLNRPCLTQPPFLQY